MNNTQKISILNYNPSHFDAFRKINLDWISDKYVVEDVDHEVLNDPEKHILNPGGYIFMAQFGDALVGTCSMTYEGEGIYELTKMGVDKNYRGLKIGYLLGEAVVNKAKELNAKKLILHSNREGSAEAIQLYKKLGFVEVPMGDVPWKRSNIKMEIEMYARIIINTNKKSLPEKTPTGICILKRINSILMPSALLPVLQVQMELSGQ